jgi:sulfite reductase beta subunit-like hemoprotein
MGPSARRLTWAISGCHNSCTQPQLADIGIVSSRFDTSADGQRVPLFDMYRSTKTGLGEKIETALTLPDLIAVVRRMD